ncbi:MAG TPA: fatty acid desaturase [Vicinamibacterales bacterium]|nr:fatty acid desaturase [Vicinamibacterales bacterium]
MRETISIDHGTLRELSVPSIRRTALDLVLVWGLIGAMMLAAHWLDRWYVYALAAVIVGSRQNALATLAHEAWHGLLFRSQPLNHAMGRWLYAYPIGILYYHDRTRHLRHHRTVGHDHDPDWINYATATRETPARVVLYLASLLLGRMLVGSVVSFATRGRPRIGVQREASVENGPGVASELACVVICQAVMATAMTAGFGRWWSYPLLWLLPLATFAGFFANFRAFVEHVTPDDRAAPAARLRDIAAGSITRFFISPSHFNFHALHHAHPSIPHYNLPRGRREYVRELGVYPFEVWPGYLTALRRHLRSLQARAASSKG